MRWPLETKDSVGELVALVERAALLLAVNDAEDVVEEVVEMVLVEVADAATDPVLNECRRLRRVIS
jgi:hypothetical protein